MIPRVLPPQIPIIHSRKFIILELISPFNIKVMIRKYNFWIDKLKSAVIYPMLLIVIMAGLFSCEETLEKTPTDRFSDEAVWVDANLIEAFVNRTYREMPTSRYNGSFTSTALIFGELTDELYGRGGNHNYINEGEVTPAQLGALDYWTGNPGSNYYNVVTNCNIFFSNIDEAPVEDEIKNRMIGEMKVLRAFA